MGGPGSGNFRDRHGRKRRTVEAGRTITVSQLGRQGALRPGARASGSWVWDFPGGGSFAVAFAADTIDPGRASIELSYSWAMVAGGDPVKERYRVALTTTRPRLGGLRWWFACPLAVGGRPCGRRV